MTESSKQLVCPTCGSHLATGATRCSVCGTVLAGKGGKAKGGSSNVSLPLPFALAILAGFAILTAGLTFFLSRSLGGTFSAEPSPTVSLTPTGTNTATVTPTSTLIPTFTPLPTLEYIVMEGDTFLGIAVRYDVSVQSILQMNPGFNSQTILSVGQKLYLAQPTPTPSPEPSATLPPEEATRAACETITYTVEANDTLGAIAENYNVNQRAIMDYNGMTSETVFLGQILILPLCERNPTPGPSPTPTPPPPYPAPNLLLPQDGAPFTLANDTVTLQWASVGELRDNESYRITVEDITEGSGTVRLVAFVRDTKYVVPSTFRPNESIPHAMRWVVQVVRQVGVLGSGEPRYEEGGAVSQGRIFTWSGAAIAGTPTP
jgi:LysM repeat protein